MVRPALRVPGNRGKTQQFCRLTADARSIVRAAALIAAALADGRLIVPCREGSPATRALVGRGKADALEENGRKMILNRTCTSRILPPEKPWLWKPGQSGNPKGDTGAKREKFMNSPA